VLGRLRERFGRDAFSLVEHWDDDTCAVGVAGAGPRTRLVYISTCNLPPGRYDVSVEDAPRLGGAPAADDEIPRDTVEHLVGVDFDGLAALVARHLQLASAGTPPS
jgi:hypothetical protein